VWLQLKRAWSDGTRQLVFSPLESVEKLAALVPPPRVNQTFYHGVLGARSDDAWAPKHNGKQGRPQKFSDLAIEIVLTLRLVFHLPLALVHEGNQVRPRAK